MKGTATWQAFTQAQIKRIFTETGYGQYSLPKDGICVYSSQTTEWKSANIVGLPSPPSQELAGKLNDKQISLVPKTISK